MEKMKIKHKNPIISFVYHSNNSFNSFTHFFQFLFSFLSPFPFLPSCSLSRSHCRSHCCSHSHYHSHFLSFYYSLSPFLFFLPFPLVFSFPESDAATVIWKQSSLIFFKKFTVEWIFFHYLPKASLYAKLFMNNDADVFRRPHKFGPYSTYWRF